MDNKLEIIKSIRDLQKLGVQFDKFYTIDDDLDELKFALEIGNNCLNEIKLNHKIEQLGQLVSIGLETINPKVTKESPLNPRNWGLETWKFIKYFTSENVINCLDEQNNQSNQNNQNNIEDIKK